MRFFTRLIQHNKTNLSFLETSAFEQGRTLLKSKGTYIGSGVIHAEIFILCKEGRLKEAVDILHQMDQRGIMVDSDTYASLLEACGNIKALAEGKQVHSNMSACGIDDNVFLGTKLVNMYAKCGSLMNARLVFDKISKCNMFLWTAMIGGYARQGHYEEALELYSRMHLAGIQADNFIFPRVLNSCAQLSALQRGKEVHDCIIKSGFESDVCVANALIDMYGKCGSLEDARQLFDKMSQRDVVSWNAAIAGYMHYGHANEGLKLFQHMQLTGMKPNSVTIATVLLACFHSAGLQLGKEIHDYVIRNGLDFEFVMGNALMDMYAKCGRVHYARQVFDKMLQRDMVSWKAMIAGYSQRGCSEDALELFRQMQEAGLKPDSPIIVAVLTACAQSGALREGKEIHAYIMRSGLESDVFVGNTLIDMYAKSQRIESAQRVFEKIPQKDLVSWNVMITGFAQNGHIDDALKLFYQMPLAGVKPDIITWNALIAAYAHLGCGDEALRVFQQMQKTGITPNTISWTVMIAGNAQCRHDEKAFWLFHQMQLAGVKSDCVTIATVLQACIHVPALKQGKEIHACILKGGYESELFLENALIDMYAKCGSIEDSRHVFDKILQRDRVSWNTMIAGYAQKGHGDEAFKLFDEMQMAGLKPCMITWNALISGYAQNGNGSKALKLIRQMHLAGSKPNLISWTAMIAGYAHSGQGNEALKLFRQMQQAGLKCDTVTLMSVLPACAHLPSLEQGKEVHNYILRHGFESDIFMGNALIDMYAKCGSIENAHLIFDKMSQRNFVSWTTMIMGYAMHGQGECALKLFLQMQQAGLRPDHITFIGVLSACSHAGLVAEGCRYFDLMSRDYGITPSMEHHACMVDLLGRAGRLDEAHDFINKMPVEPNASVWGALLGACRVHGNTELGKLVAEHLFKLEPKNAGYYVLLSNIYAAAGRWDDVVKVRKMMKEEGLTKRPGCSWIKVEKIVHAFLVGDKSHPQQGKIFATLESLAEQMNKAGYVPDMNFVMHDV
eukprot:Gb_40503 [translate_table: standard]